MNLHDKPQTQRAIAADLLAQRRFADNQVGIRPVLAEDRPLPGERRLHGLVLRLLVRQARVGHGQCPGVFRRLQQRGYPLRLVDRDLRGSGLEE